MNMNAHLQSQYELAVSGYLKQWSVVQLIISHGFAGSSTNEKIDWFTTAAVPQIFYENGHLYPDDIEYYLSHILFHEFDTVVEDGSLAETSRKLIELYELYRNGNVQLLQDQVNLFNQVARQRQEPGIVQSMNAMQISPELAETSNTSTNHNQLDQNINTTTQEWNDNDESNDGWQVVRSRKKKDR